MFLQQYRSILKYSSRSHGGVWGCPPFPVVASYSTWGQMCPWSLQSADKKTSVDTTWRLRGLSWTEFKTSISSTASQVTTMFTFLPFYMTCCCEYHRHIWRFSHANLTHDQTNSRRVGTTRSESLVNSPQKEQRSITEVNWDCRWSAATRVLETSTN